MPLAPGYGETPVADDDLDPLLAYPGSPADLAALIAVQPIGEWPDESARP